MPRTSVRGGSVQPSSSLLHQDHPALSGFAQPHWDQAHRAKAFPRDTGGPKVQPQQELSSPLNEAHGHRLAQVPEGSKAAPVWGLGGEQASHPQCSQHQGRRNKGHSNK